MVGLSDGQTMLHVAGDFNATIGVVEPGDEESIGRFGWGTRNRKGRELVEMSRRNGLAVAGTFFQANNSHNITYRSGRHNTEFDLLVVRQQQLSRVNSWKELAGDYVTTQNKSVAFKVRMKKWKEKRTKGPKNIKWWKCKDEMKVEYREKVRRKYEELDAEKGTVEGEWRQYKDAFVGGGGGVVWQNVGERRYTKKQKPRMVDGKGGKGSGGEAGSMADDKIH